MAYTKTNNSAKGFGGETQQNSGTEQTEKVHYAKTPDDFMAKAMAAGAEQIFAMANQVSEAQMPQVIDNVARLNAMRLAQANANGVVASKTLEYLNLGMDAAHEKTEAIEGMIESHFASQVVDNPDFFTMSLAGGSTLPQLGAASK